MMVSITADKQSNVKSKNQVTVLIFKDRAECMSTTRRCIDAANKFVDNYISRTIDDELIDQYRNYRDIFTEFFEYIVKISAHNEYCVMPNEVAAVLDKNRAEQFLMISFVLMSSASVVLNVLLRNE